MDLILVVSRIVHVSTAITLVGGTLFMLCVLMPSAKRLSDEAHQTLSVEVMGRWKRFVHIGILLFLISGFYNFFQALADHKGDGLYHGLMGTKILLALGMFFIASALVGRSARLQSLRDNKAFWLKVMVVLAIAIVCISGFVKVRGPNPQLATPASRSAELTPAVLPD
ncbi:MAG: hypothetical protein ACO1RT_15535 [Planctomycetaceae bacterium]